MLRIPTNSYVWFYQLPHATNTKLTPTSGFTSYPMLRIPTNSIHLVLPVTPCYKYQLTPFVWFYYTSKINSSFCSSLHLLIGAIWFWHHYDIFSASTKYVSCLNSPVLYFWQNTSKFQLWCICKHFASPMFPHPDWVGGGEFFNMYPGAKHE